MYFLFFWKNKEKEIVSLDFYIAGITRILIKEKLRKRKVTYNIDLFSEQRNAIEKIEKKYKKLSTQELEILNLFYYADKSIKDIAIIMNLSEVNVKTKLFRIRKKIKKELMK